MTPAVREAIGRVRAWSPTYQYQDIYIVLAALDKAEVEIARKDAALNRIADQSEWVMIQARDAIAAITEGRGG